MWNILLRNKSECDSYSLQVEKKWVKWKIKWWSHCQNYPFFSQNQLIQCQRWSFKQEQGLKVLLRAKNASLFDYIQHSWEKITGKYILTQAGVEPIISLLNFPMQRLKCAPCPVPQGTLLLHIKEGCAHRQTLQWRRGWSSLCWSRPGDDNTINKENKTHWNGTFSFSPRHMVTSLSIYWVSKQQPWFMLLPER